MVSIHSREENKFILEFARNNSLNAKRIWIGAKRSSSGAKEFLWNIRIHLLIWDLGEANNFGGKERFVEMF
jgi:hypothetical protein